MRVMDLYRGIGGLRGDSVSAFLKTWKQYMNDPDLYRVCLEDASGYDLKSQVLPVIRHALENRDLIDRAHDNFLAIIDELRRKYNRLFKEPDVCLVFYLGLCSGAGWVVDIKEKDHILFGVEKIVELRWEKRPQLYHLVCHELGHVAYKHLGGTLADSTSENNAQSIRQLHSEGFAEHVASLLSPYQNSRGPTWLNWCEANLDCIKHEFLGFLKEGRDTQPFFGDWSSILGHSDLGYFLGLKFIETLAKDHDLKTIARMEIDKIRSHLVRFLTA